MEKTIVKEKIADPPFSLHDAHLLSLVLRGDALGLSFQSGFVETVPLWRQVDGSMEITGLEWGFCSVYVMDYTSVRCGNYGRFVGEKMTVAEFVRTYQPLSVDIMDETYGHNQVKLSGFLNHGQKCLEVVLELYYHGEIRYLL